MNQSLNVGWLWCRWVMFSAELEVAIATGQTFDQGAFDAALLKRDISWQYAQNSTTYANIYLKFSCHIFNFFFFFFF